MRLTLEEQETIINFNNGEDTAHIYTCNKPLMKHMEQLLGIKPTQVYSYAREYECPKEWIRKPRKPRKSPRLSEELKARLIERISQKPVLNEVSA